MRKTILRWRANFFTGLLVVMPVVASLAIVLWLFSAVSGVTNSLLFFLPKTLTHAGNGQGQMSWYWSVLALLISFLLVALVGRATRNYVGRQLIRGVDRLMSSVPLLNKIYGTLKQVNEAFTSTQKSSFKQVVLIEYPRKGIHSIGFVTNDEIPEASVRLGQTMVGVFVPTTPNPTSGFLMVVPHDQIIRLDMTVTDAFKYVFSLGSIAPELRAPSVVESRQIPE